MKFKPAVKNELFLKDVLTLHNEDVGATLRVAVQYGDIVVMKVPEHQDEDYKKVYLLFTSEQMEQLFTLWEEWKDEDETTEPEGDTKLSPVEGQGREKENPKEVGGGTHAPDTTGRGL